MKKEVPQNIEAFNSIVLHVLITLYDKFPVPIDLDSDQIIQDALPDETENYKDLAFSNIAAFTLEWLEQEGFITVGSRPMVGRLFYSDARLTLKGLTLLGLPASVSEGKPKETMVNRAKAVFAKATEQSATDVVQKLFWAALNHLPKMID